jgi:hypothetical protein
MGFGFRGASPPWPYVGIGRGGRPRCGYFLSGAGAYPARQHPLAFPHSGSAGSMSREEELDYLKDQAEVIKEQLNNIDARMRTLEAKE